jgi:hypothetical protein
MSEAPDSGRTPAERVDDIPRMLAAMRQAVREALLDHHRAGNPVAVWRDEQVVWIQPEDIPAELARASEADAVDELDPARD